MSAGGRTDGLTSRLERATAHGRGITFIDDAGPVPVSWARMHEESRSVAAWFQERGVEAGDRVALAARTSRDLVAAVQGVWLAGAAAVILPLPHRWESAQAFAAQTRSRLLQADVRLAV